MNYECRNLCVILNRGCTKATALLHKQWLLIGTTYFKPVQLRPIAAPQIGANMMPYLFIFFIFIAKAFTKASGIKRKKTRQLLIVAFLAVLLVSPKVIILML